MPPQRSKQKANTFKYAPTPPKYKTPKRIQLLSIPKKRFDIEEGMPNYTKSGTRESALRGHLYNNDIAWPYLRNLLTLRRTFGKKLSQERLQQVNRMIEASNATVYSKLAGCTRDFKKNDAKDLKRKKGWSEAEWKKHMEYIAQVAAPKKDFRPPPIPRGKAMPLEDLMPRLNIISTRPDFKCYRTLSKESWYRDPEKVSPEALKYKITERIAKLAVAKVTIPD